MSSGPAIDERIPPPKRRRAWRPPFGVWRNAIFGAILLSPFFVRGWFLSQVPEFPVPFDVDEFCHVVIPPGRNAFDHYREAYRMKKLVDADPGVEKLSVNEEYEVVVAQGWNATSDRFKAWVEHYRPAVAEWRLGTELTEAQFLPILETDFLQSLDVIQTLRSFGRFAVYEAARLEEDRDFAGAADWHLAILRCSRHSAKRGMTIERLVGCALHNLGSERLIHWSTLPESTAEQIHQVQTEIRRIDEFTVPMSTTLKVEYIGAINSFKNPDWWQLSDHFAGNSSYAEGILNSHPECNPMPSVLKAGYWVLAEPLRTQRLLRHVLTNQLNEVDKPLSQRRPDAGTAGELLFQVDPNAPQMRNQLDPIEIDIVSKNSIFTVELLASLLRGLDIATTGERARQALLVAGLAAQEYRREHGEFPHDPQSLVPIYLEKWPADPWDKTGQPIRYRRDSAASAVVWSVGHNFTDESGDVGTENYDFRSLDYGIRLKTR